MKVTCFVYWLFNTHTVHSSTTFKMNNPEQFADTHLHGYNTTLLLNWDEDVQISGIAIVTSVPYHYSSVITTTNNLGIRVFLGTNYYNTKTVTRYFPVFSSSSISPINYYLSSFLLEFMLYHKSRACHLLTVT